MRVNFVCLVRHTDRVVAKEGKERDGDGDELAEEEEMNRGQLRHICSAEITLFVAWHGKVFRCVVFYLAAAALESFHPHSISIKWNTYIVYCQSPKMANKLF